MRRRLTKYGLLKNIECNHSPRSKFGLTRITFKKCHTLVSGIWMFVIWINQQETSLFYRVSSLLTSVRAKVLFPDFFGPVIRYTSSILLVPSCGSGMEERAIPHDGGSMKAWISLVWCIIYTLMSSRSEMFE